MLKRLLARLKAMPKSQQALVAIGVPAVAVVAVVNRQRGTSPSADAGEGDQFAAGSGVQVVDPSAVGVGFSQLGDFANSFTDEIGLIEKRLELIEGQRAEDEATGGGAPPDVDPDDPANGSSGGGQFGGPNPIGLSNAQQAAINAMCPGLQGNDLLQCMIANGIAGGQG